MNYIIGIITMLIFILPDAAADVYVIIYATHDGKTGHAGIAIDKYDIKIRDCKNAVRSITYDTVKNGALIYYDLWPGIKEFPKYKLLEEVPAVYYRLPGSSSERPITLHSLSSIGIPHEMGYPCDGLIRIKSNYHSDKMLEAYIDELIVQMQSFHSIHYNCATFVKQSIEFLLEKKIIAEELIMPGIYATTPNRLYESVAELPGVTTLKNPGNKTKGSFWEERILKQ